MTSNILAILIIAGLVGVVLLIRFIVNSAINKGVDAIHNAVADKKDRDKPNEPQNLSDRYRK